MSNGIPMREIQRLANLRMEQGARTEEDYHGVAQMWDKLDANRERKERYHEFCCDHNTIRRAPDDKSDWLDIIFDNANDFCQLIEDADPSEAVNQLSTKQKEVLYLHKVRVYSITQIAYVKGQSSRNIRKMKALLLIRIQDKMLLRISKRIETGPSITNAMRWFIERHEKGEQR